MLTNGGVRDTEQLSPSERSCLLDTKSCLLETKMLTPGETRDKKVVSGTRTKSCLFGYLETTFLSLVSPGDNFFVSRRQLVCAQETTSFCQRQLVCVPASTTSFCQRQLLCVQETTSFCQRQLLCVPETTILSLLCPRDNFGNVPWSHHLSASEHHHGASPWYATMFT